MKCFVLLSILAGLFMVVHSQNRIIPIGGLDPLGIGNILNPNRPINNPIGNIIGGLTNGNYNNGRYPPYGYNGYNQGYHHSYNHGYNNGYPNNYHNNYENSYGYNSNYNSRYRD